MQEPQRIMQMIQLGFDTSQQGSMDYIWVEKEIKTKVPNKCIQAQELDFGLSDFKI